MYGDYAPTSSRGLEPARCPNLRGVTDRCGFLVAVLLATTPPAHGEPIFAVRENVRGINYRNVCGTDAQIPILEQNGQGIGIVDFDGDGLMDLFVANGSTESRWRKSRLSGTDASIGDTDRTNPGCRLFRNLGGWRFQDVTAAAGIRENSWSCGVSVADFDADGDFDVYVLNWGPNTLYRNNGDGTFTDVTKSAGVGDPRWSSSAAFADFNGDGLLDIYVSNYVHFDYDDYPTKEKDGRECLYRDIKTGCGPWCYEGQRDTLFINVGEGRFEDRSRAAGLACTKGYRGFGVVAADFDLDGDADVYVGCDVMPNLYLENMGGAVFRSVGTEKGGAFNQAGKHESGMGVAAADFDGSGTLDLLITNFAHESNTIYANQAGYFSDRSAAIGFDRHLPEMGWGVIARDFDQDGRVDVFVANGHIYPQVKKLNDPLDRYAVPPRLYLQGDGGLLVEPVSPFGKPLAYSLRGCAVVDLDNDNDLDIVAVQHNGPLVFFENLSNRPAFAVELIDARGGRSPMGARVSIDRQPGRWYLPNQGYQSSGDHRMFLARPPSATTVQAEVLWPDGSRERYRVDTTAKGAITLRQGTGVVIPATQ